MKRLRSVTAIALALLVLSQPACTTWRVAASPAAALSRGPSEVRVTRADGSRTSLHNPAIEGDAIAGYTAPNQSGERTSIALSQVTSVETRSSSGKTTAMVVLAVGGVAALALLLASGSGGGAGY